MVTTVYLISDYGLLNQLNVSKLQDPHWIEDYVDLVSEITICLRALTEQSNPSLTLSEVAKTIVSHLR
jgi:hypothetical protein